MSSSPAHIRTASLDDVDWLADCAIAMALETEHLKLDRATVHAGVAAGVADAAKARYFVAENGEGEPVGTLMLTREWSDWRNGDWWWIQSVYVVPTHRRFGVFTTLYRHAAQLARDTPGVVGLRLYVEKDNHDAQRAYAALGMQDAGYAMFEMATSATSSTTRESGEP